MTSFADIFRELNSLVEDGIIKNYSVAGATAFLFYTEPVRTYDVDVFIFLPQQHGLIISMSPLYDELRKRGFSFDAEHVIISGTPVQFLPAYNALAEEAVLEAVAHEYDGVPVRVISPEHLVALAFQTGGKNRRVRAESMLDENAVDTEKLKSILNAHNINSPISGDTNE